MSALEIHATEHTAWCLALDKSGDFPCDCQSAEAVLELAALRALNAAYEKALRHIASGTKNVSGYGVKLVTLRRQEMRDVAHQALLQRTTSEGSQR